MFHHREGSEMVRKLVKSRWGTAEIVGTVLFLVILLFFFSNVFLWSNQATRDMDQIVWSKMNSEVRMETVGGVPLRLTVTNWGGVDVALSRLWMANLTVTANPEQDHVYADLEFLNLWVAGGSQRQIILDDVTVFNADGSVSVTLNGDSAIVHYAPPLGQIIIFKILTRLGNMAACSYDFTTTTSALLSDGFEWDDNWDATTSNWYLSPDQRHSGSYSVKSSNGREGDLDCDPINASNAVAITVDFWYRINNTESPDFMLYFYDGSSWDEIVELGGGTYDSWLHYAQTITDSQYFNSNFRIRFSSGLTGSEDVWVDDVSITKQST
jgi:hypothetical protein